MRAAGSLTRFQDGFVHALFSTQNPELLVYRNTILKGCIDALQANYPAVARLVGEEWFRAAAAVYARAHPPRVPMLLEYGARFADFLAGFEPATALPYLPAVARLDRFWSESHAARDDQPLRAETLAPLDPMRLGATVLQPHAAARWAWFAVPAFTIWSRNRAESPAVSAEPEIEWCGEGALVARPGDAVEWLPLDEASCAFMDACAAGGTLAQAAAAAQAVAPAVDLAALLARLLRAGAFAHQEC